MLTLSTVEHNKWKFKGEKQSKNKSCEFGQILKLKLTIARVRNKYRHSIFANCNIFQSFITLRNLLVYLNFWKDEGPK